MCNHNKPLFGATPFMNNGPSLIERVSGFCMTFSGCMNVIDMKMSLLCLNTPVHIGAQSFHFLTYCSEKWNAEGLCSDGNASNKTVPFQKMERLKSDTKSGTIGNRSVQFLIPNRQLEKMSAKRLRSCLNTKHNWYASILFLCEQPICPFQKLEQRLNGTIAVPCELRLILNGAVVRILTAWRLRMKKLAIVLLLRYEHICSNISASNKQVLPFWQRSSLSMHTLPLS